MVRPRKIATGQQYGKAKEQEEMIAASEDAAMPKPAPPRPKPINIHSPTRMPQQSINTPGTGLQTANQKEEMLAQRREALNLLPYIESIASLPNASPSTKRTARQLVQFVGNVDELIIRED